MCFQGTDLFPAEETSLKYTGRAAVLLSNGSKVTNEMTMLTPRLSPRV